MRRAEILVAVLITALSLGLPGVVRAAAGAEPAAARIRGPVDESHRVELAGQIHRALADSVDLGTADPAQRADRIILVLTGSPAQQADLHRFLRNQQQRGHPDFHRWLSPAAFAERFGVAGADRAVIKNWLTSKGFQVDAEPAGGRSISFSGTFGQLDDAFGAQMHRYRWHGEEHVANAANPSVPGVFSGVIAGFASLNDFRLRSQLVRGDTRIAQRGASPRFTEANGAHYLAPADFAIIYDLAAPYAQGTSGAGRSIAVLGRSDVVTGDLSTFRATFGLPAGLPTIIVNGTDPGLVSGDELESDLDLEWAGAVAPSASIDFVTSASTQTTDGITLSAQYAVSNDLADVITVSYGGCEASGDVSGGTTFFNQLWQQAAAQGTSVIVSAGDSGAAGCDTDTSARATHGLGVNALCSSPYSTCVGGTEFAADVSNPSTYWSSSNNATTQASALSYIGEDVWNQSGSDGGSALYASGGGASLYFAKPAWQLATGVPSDGHRDVPDLALNASSAHDGYVVFTSQGYSSSSLVSVGGTSASAPAMAGITALVAQHEGGRLGSINATLYGLSGLQAAGGAAVFHRITVGNNSVPGQSGFAASTADPDYNQSTGLGSIDGAQLLAHWNSVAAATAGLTPSYAAVTASAAVGSATLTLPAATKWTAAITGGAGWLSVSPTSGTGSAVLTYAATANSATTARSATITIDGQGLTLSQAAATAASGNAAQLTLSTGTISFGTEAIGTSSGDTQLLLANVGNANLTLGSISLLGTSANAFADSGSCAANVVLIPGAVCYLDVSFAPTATGSDTASLQIDIGTQAAATVALTGAATPDGDTDTDGPLPAWAYALLTSLLLVVARRPRRASPSG
jgi:subtilase family serine protease